MLVVDARNQKGALISQTYQGFPDASHHLTVFRSTRTRLGTKDRSGHVVVKITVRSTRVSKLYDSHEAIVGWQRGEQLTLHTGSVESLQKFCDNGATVKSAFQSFLSADKRLARHCQVVHAYRKVSELC